MNSEDSASGDDADESESAAELEPAPENIGDTGVSQVSSTSPNDEDTKPHTVTQEDHDRVEDLLKQFRDRYGRE
ncbi:MAG: hypothetical protein ACPIB0_06145 [Akkermansiaceae bacterium]